MRATIPVVLLFAVVAAIVILLFFAVFLETSYGNYLKGTLDLTFKGEIPHTFDINDLLTNDSNAFSVNEQNNYYFNTPDPAFCKALRNCTKYNIKGGKRCLISYKVKPGTSFDPNNIIKSIAACPLTDIEEELNGGISRKVCKFARINNYNAIREDNISLIKYEPEIHGCSLPESLGTLNVLGDTDSINYLYSGRGKETGYDFFNGGLVRIVVTNTSVKNDGSCSYSLYVCGQNAIAKSVNETPVQVFKNIQKLDDSELYFNESVFWGGIPPKTDNNFVFDISIWGLLTLLYGSQNNKNIPYNLYGYHPHTYEFMFNGAYKNRFALIDAIDAGMWEWNKINFYNIKKIKYFSGFDPTLTNIHFSYSPINSSNITQDSSISFGSGCWKSDFESSDTLERLTFSDSSFPIADSFKHAFKFDNFNIGNKIRMTLGTKKLFISGKVIKLQVTWFGFIVAEETTSMVKKINGKNNLNIKPELILVLDPITFCSE
jgi:hypothetical protein